MPKLVFIEARPGPTTSERVLEVVSDRPGISVAEIGGRLNRPVSMVLICLKELASAGKVRARVAGKRRLYYPRER